MKFILKKNSKDNKIGELSDLIREIDKFIVKSRKNEAETQNFIKNCFKSLESIKLNFERLKI